MKKFIGIIMAVLMIFAFTACDSLNEYRAEAKEALETYVTEKGETNYTEANWKSIQDLVDKGKDAIDEAKDEAEIDSAVDKAKADIDKIAAITLAEHKTAAKTALDSYVKEDDYTEENWATIEGKITAGKTAIDAATTKAAVNTALAAAKTEIDKVAAMTLAEYKTAAKTTLDGYVKEDDYTEENWATIEGKITAGKTAIDAATTKAAVNTALAAAKTEIDKVAAMTLAEYKTAAKTTLDGYVNEEDYTEENWATIEDIIATAKTAIDAADAEAGVDTALQSAKDDIDAIDPIEVVNPLKMI